VTSVALLLLTVGTARKLDGIVKKYLGEKAGSGVTEVGRKALDPESP
jgi:hypothetical protein